MRKSCPPSPPGIEIPGYLQSPLPGAQRGMIWKSRMGQPPVARDFNPGRRGRVALCAALLTLCTGILHADDLHGHIQLLAKGGKGPARGSDVRQAVVYFEPASPQPVKAPEKPFEMITRHKEFEPRLLVIPRGAKVRFPNEDPILHNVFSVSAPNQFDLGLYQQGPGKEKRFERPGVVRVYCNVHHDMVAYILVLDTPFHASPDANGEFALLGLPRGKGKLTIWHEQADPVTVDVDLPQKGPLAVGLQVVRPLIPSHLDKSGKSYFRSGDRYEDR